MHDLILTFLLVNIVKDSNMTLRIKIFLRTSMGMSILSMTLRILDLLGPERNTKYYLDQVVLL